MNVSGVPLCARFSIATNRLNYCGPADADRVLGRAIRTGEDLAAAATLLRQFEALEPYLAAIAAKHGREPFDREVVEAYWIGNRLLDAFTREDFRGILRVLRTRGLPGPVAARISAHLPERPIPHHTFHVTFVGVGAVSGKVATTLEAMERCRPSLARVVRMGPDALEVETNSLRVGDRRLSLGPPERSTLPFDPSFLPDVAEGRWVACHWRWPAVVLELDQVARLETYTARSLEAASEGLAFLGVL